MEELERRASTLEAQGDLDQAAALYRQVLAQTATLHESLGLLELTRRNGAAAIPLLETASYLQPENPGFHVSLARALLAAGRDADALEHVDAALEIDADFPAAYDMRAIAAFVAGDGEGAEEALRHGLHLDPDKAERVLNLAVALLSQNRAVEALAWLRRALELTPDSAPAIERLVGCLFDLGRFEDGRAAAASAPLHALFPRLADPTQSHDEVATFFKGVGRALSAPSVEPHANGLDPDRPLRVGYMSADFREHSTSCFFSPVFAAHDRAQVHVFAYHVDTRRDATTETLAAHCNVYRGVGPLTDDELEAQIREDRIDILVDAQGPTAGHRLGVFGRRPAPILVSEVIYPVGADYYVVDDLTDPPGLTERHYDAELVRLPSTFQCYEPPACAPAVAPTPAATRGHVTFGSFNSYHKLNDDVLALWARVLTRVPTSRLVVKCKLMADPDTERELRGRLERLGVDARRVDLHPCARARADHLARYADVDVALDTLPFSGATTTCEALWMGVPVVTLAGTAHMGRVSVSILENVGLGELVAQTAEDFVDIADRLARDVPRLAELRAEMRARLERSPLLDAKAYTAELEAAYRRMWRRHCAEASQRKSVIASAP
jgi:predicted O-linked N-acetylglucosamine transferase (SPINDLY family)